MVGLQNKLGPRIPRFLATMAKKNRDEFLNVGFHQDNYFTMKLICRFVQKLREAFRKKLKSGLNLFEAVRTSKQRMVRPQTKININRKETRIFGAVYE